ncbi:hypothetical protein V2S66_12640 [Streptomyces sp. V4-01]|uniref:Uncharacterized protein n=1 Tax=Actinacidiphila polyblastidii TaxID=3110430 RepID=A0ABU7PAJ4_9ACTN|nr:hypothetical protein [Streptomyces sp. V4-01]
MTRRLSPAQRRAVGEADPATGRLSAAARVCSALAAAGLAVPHGRGGHHSYYLTADGRRLRDALAEGAADAAADAAEPGTTPGARSGPAAGSFRADDGTGKDPAPPAAQQARRAADVTAAWEGLLQIRAVLADGVTGVPAPWERDRQVHAVALALEAAGCPPARPGSPGYRVTPSAHQGLAEVGWTEPSSAAAALAKCAELLAAFGWQPTTHRTRGGVPYLLTSPATR